MMQCQENIYIEYIKIDIYIYIFQSKERKSYIEREREKENEVTKGEKKLFIALLFSITLDI